MFPLASSEVKAQEAALAALCAALDPDAIPLAEVSDVWASLATMERLVAGAKCRLARRVEESSTWKQDGDRSAASWLARHAGTSVAQAQGTLDTSKKLEQLPRTREAVQRGELSAAQTEAVADAAVAAPASERRLLELAARRSLGELRDECARTKAAADRDTEARHERLHRERGCRRRATVEGGGEIVYRSTLDEVAEVWSVIQGYAEREFRRARAEGRREPPDAYAADAVLSMARAAKTPACTDRDVPAARPPAVDKIIVRIDWDAFVRIDWDAFVRGWPIDGEVCEIAGHGPVPVSLVRSMAASGDAFLAAVVTKGVDVATVAHLGRKATAHQLTALQWRDPVCDVDGCNNTWRLQIDHRADWADTKVTALWLLDRKCGHHHDLKTYQGWASVPGTGKRAFVPPGHPDHPGDEGRPRPGPDPPTVSGDAQSLWDELESAIEQARQRKRMSSQAETSAA
jgi:hypothetical protein